METSRPHILVVDDDTRLRSLLKQYLSDNGFLVTTASDAPDADAKMGFFAFDALVLDVMMPGETGMEMARRLRGKLPPTLMLTAMGETENRIEGLESGVDDYLTKPFEPRELVLRLQSILRRRSAAPETAAEALQFGEYRFDSAGGQLYKGEEAVYLTTAELQCLQLLAAQPGEPISRERIAAVSGSGGNERSADVLINRLRKKIEPVPGKPVYIQTVRSRGYVLRVS